MKWLVPRKYRWIFELRRLDEEAPEKMKEYVRGMMPMLTLPSVKFPKLKPSADPQAPTAA